MLFIYFCRYTDNLIDHSIDHTPDEIKNSFSGLYNFLDEAYAFK
jgi:hypothetical protein